MYVFLYNLTLFYSVSFFFFFWAATAFDIFGTDNAEELLTCGFQYPSLPINNRAPARQMTGTFFFPVVITVTHLPDGRLYLFFPVVITIANDRLPARQMTGTFLFSGHNNDRAPARQTNGTFFFPVVITIAHLPDRRLYLYFRS